MTNQPRNLGIARHFTQRRAGERADRVEGNVPQQLHPDFAAQPRGQRRLDAGLDQRFGNLPEAVGACAVLLTQGDAGALDEANHAGFGDLGGEVHDGADDAARINRLANHPARVHALEARARQFTRAELEVPPREAVLRAHDGGGFADEGRNLGRELRQAVRFYAQEDDVHRPGFRKIADDPWADHKFFGGADDPKAILLHRAQVRSSREKGDVFVDARQAGADVAADRASACNQDPHLFAPTIAEATAPRWIFPVAVRG